MTYFYFSIAMLQYSTNMPVEHLSLCFVLQIFVNNFLSCLVQIDTGMYLT